MDRADPRDAATQVLAGRFPDAELAFLAGSVVRGEATATSDLDLVVVHAQIEQAFRITFSDHGWPIEAFVHDPGTLRYFMEEVDRPRGVPSLPAMVAEGIPLPSPSALSDRLQRQAADILGAGPPPLADEELASRRYALTDLADDLVEPRSAAEARATGVRMYAGFADFILRARGEWSATGKSVPGRLRTVDAELAKRFDDAFAALFGENDSDPVITLLESVLAPYGGRLREGYEVRAPAQWRKS